MAFVSAMIAATLISAAPTSRTDHIPNYDLSTTRSMLVVTGRCRRTTLFTGAAPGGLPRMRRARCAAAYVIFGAPTPHGDVTIFFPAPDHAAQRAFAVSGTMNDAKTLRIQAIYIGGRPAQRAEGFCRAQAPKGFDPPPKGVGSAPPSLSEIAARMDDVGTPQGFLDMSCTVIDPDNHRPVATIAFRQRRAVSRRHHAR